MSLAMCTRPEHAGMPVIECELVQLTRARRAPVCLCAHPKAVHQHWRPGSDCGKCDCRYYETAHLSRVRALAWAGLVVASAAFWVAVVSGVRAVIGH